MAHRWLAGALAALVAFGGAEAARALETAAREAVLIDHETRQVLLEKNAEARMPPSSMTKLMTLYVVFSRMKEGRLSAEDRLPVSEKAWRTGGSKMFVKVGDSVRVIDLLRGVIVQSGNDACVVLAEGLAGSEEAFARLMTEKGKEIGLTGSNFRNASGWPDPDHYMTAHDLAVLAIRLIDDFPEFYAMFKETEFVYNDIKQGNRNPLLYKSVGADGLKTGHTEAAGYGLTASAVQDGRRLVLVVNGLGGVNQRSQESERLLAWGFREFENLRLFKAGETVETAEVWLGRQPGVAMMLERPLTLTLPRAGRDGLKVVANYKTPVAAPVEKGQQVGTLRVEAAGMAPVERPLLAAEAVPRMGFFRRIGAVLSHLVFGPAAVAGGA